MNSTKSTKDEEKLSKLLLASLISFSSSNTVTGPKGDEYHHFQSVHVIKGDDSYNITAVTTIEDNEIKTVGVKVPSRAARFRGMSGICIVFWSENCYLWSRNIYFHKGCLYEEDIILEENVQLYEPDNYETAINTDQ